MHQDSYDLFVKRLKEERESAGLTQREIAAMLRMGENYYSKVETSRRRLSFYETKQLCSTLLDSFYIFTGKRVDNQGAEFLSACSYHKLLYQYEIVCMTILGQTEQNMALPGTEDRRLLEYFRYLLATETTEKTMFKKHRQYSDYSQYEMAELLGIDPKKLRELEKGKLLPDSELIWKMSHRLGVPFSLMLQSRNGLISEICYWLRYLQEDRRKLVLEMMKRYDQEL